MRWILSLDLNFIGQRTVDISVLCHFFQNELVRIVLNIELFRLDNGFDNKSFLCHSVILLKPLQLFFIDRSDIDISCFFSMQFQVLFFLIGLVSLVTNDTMDKIFLNTVVTVKIGILVAEIRIQ